VAESLGVGPAHLTPEALESLLLWVWPGNYRELTNELQRLKSVSTRPLDYVHLSEPLRQVMEQRAAQEQAHQQGALPQAQLAAALEQSNGNVSAAAESLKLHRTQFRRWAKGYGLI
jgi:transcriptional regulator of acetoin/glycerol metabolism